ncbi:hypothetical protein V8B97DRAFT_1975399 [Scleroderma yunnanense]
MARATRSGAAQDKHSDPSTQRQKHPTKKRKRVSLADNDEQPPLKQHQPENGIKDEEEHQKTPFRGLPELELTGDTPLTPAHAQKILDILELADTQGLLDRVFPLPSSDLSEPCTSKSQSGTYSLRTLFREPSQHPLRVLRAAVRNLFPISYNARSRTSSPAAQQLRFCHLAQSLLDQASLHSVPFPLDIDSILPSVSEPFADTDIKPAPSSPRPEKPSHSHYEHKYALMQRLPSGTWWSSLNSDIIPVSGKTLTGLQVANAELVAILPSSSNSPPSDPTTSESTPTVKPSIAALGTYGAKKPLGHRQKLPGPRRVSCGSFLDYGPYASFAPSFEQDGVDVGRLTLGEVYWSWEERKKRWSKELDDAPQASTSDDISPSPISDLPDLSSINTIDVHQENGVLEDLESLFSQDQIRLLKEALGSLEIEAAVQELLRRNADALKRLGELQNLRLMKPGGFTSVEEGSEEWETAQGIFDSLTLLASLRPRSAASDAPPLVPSASVLRKLHRTLPIAPTHGWYGTLPSTRSTALRDDSTLYIKSTATPIPSNPPATSTPTPVAQATTTPTTAPTQPYPAYSYNYAASYRTGYQFKAPQSYYPNAYTPQATGQTQTTSQYYPGQQYNTTGQQQYAYSWYQYTPQAQVASTTNAQPSTSQPAPTLPTTYASFFSTNTQTPGSRAVANTVLTSGGAGGAAKPYPATTAAGAMGTWPAGTIPAPGYAAAPTLPPHMRPPAIPSGQAGSTTGMYPGAYPLTGYYGAYQATPSPAQS